MASKHEIGLKHLIECNCILPQYRNTNPPVFHKFVVFSKVDRNDNVVKKLAQCDNCGAIHNVVEINKSEILPNRDSAASICTITDIRASLPEQLVAVLEANDVMSTAIWEECQHVMSTGAWGTSIVIKREQIDNEIHGKKLKILSRRKYEVVPFSARLP